MASTSGPAKDQEEPVHGPQESSSSAAAAAAAAASTDASIPAPPEGAADVSPPPPPPPPSSVQSRTHEGAREQPGDGGHGTDRSSSAAAAVDRKGKKKIGEGSSSAPPDDREQAPRKEGKKKSDSPIKKFLRSSILAIHGYAKKKLSDGKGKQPNYPNQNSKAIISKSPPHVDHKKIPMEEALNHYFGNINNAIQQREVALYLTDLDTRYSEFRPVHRDGECFYRSFMFSYLEQVVDRVDTCEEDRLLDAVRKLASRAEHLQWASEFSRRREAFETLIEKIKGLKGMSEQPTSAISYDRGELLLELFSSYDTTDDIFAFLRLVAAIWICTHKGLYGQRVTGLGECVSLEDWCSTQVIPPRVHADHVTMSALSRALGVAVQVEDTLDGRKKDLMAAELQSTTRASNPRFRKIEDMYCVARGNPRVTLVRMYSHYDILYPLPPGATSIGPNLLQPERQQQGGGRSQHPAPAVQTSSRGAAEGDPTAETSSRRAGQGDVDLAESSSQGAARARQRAASANWFHCCIRGGSKKKS